jgi:bifunctional DNA-binding transcriptional regulator/antitoxin component of YhaV-PrlF toxin-antitoxin module
MKAIKPVSTVQLSEKGQITIPVEYRRAHGLSKDSMLLLIELGEGLMLLPHDPMLESICARLEAAMSARGLTVDDLQRKLERVREELYANEFGRTKAHGSGTRRRTRQPK